MDSKKDKEVLLFQLNQLNEAKSSTIKNTYSICSNNVCDSFFYIIKEQFEMYLDIFSMCCDFEYCSKDLEEENKIDEVLKKYEPTHGN